MPRKGDVHVVPSDKGGGSRWRGRVERRARTRHSRPRGNSKADRAAKPVGGAASRAQRSDPRAQHVRARSAPNQRLTCRLALAVTRTAEAIRRLDEPSAEPRPRWTLVDAAWTPDRAATASRDTGTSG
jgi:hypothetical protein